MNLTEVSQNCCIPEAFIMAAVSSFIKNAKPCILRMLLLTLVASSARPKHLYVGLVSVCPSVVCLSLQLIAGMSRNEDRHRLVFSKSICWTAVSDPSETFLHDVAYGLFPATRAEN